MAEWSSPGFPHLGSLRKAPAGQRPDLPSRCSATPLPRLAEAAGVLVSPRYQVEVETAFLP